MVIKNEKIVFIMFTRSQHNSHEDNIIFFTMIFMYYIIKENKKNKFLTECKKCILIIY